MITSSAAQILQSTVQLNQVTPDIVVVVEDGRAYDGDGDGERF